MSTNILIFTIGILPSILLGLYIWWKDPQKEPVSLLMRGFLYGCFICAPVILVENEITVFLNKCFVLPNYARVFTDAFVMAAMTEEGFKLLALWFLVKNNPYFDEHFDGIVYAVFVSLGFAAVENVLYLFGNGDWITTALLRSFLAVPGHYMDAVFMGYFFSMFYFVERSLKNAILIILVPVLVHGLYDTIALGDYYYPYLDGILFPLLVVFCVYMHGKANDRLKVLIDRDRIE